MRNWFYGLCSCSQICNNVVVQYLCTSEMKPGLNFCRVIRHNLEVFDPVSRPDPVVEHYEKQIPCQEF